MLDRTKDILVSAQAWLDEFERAIAKPDDHTLDSLFVAGSFWRDVLALSWTLQTINGRDAILATLKAQAGAEKPSGFVIAPGRAAPRKVMRAGTDCVETIFNFDTRTGRGDGIIRLTADANDGNRLKAWTLLSDMPR